MKFDFVFWHHRAAEQYQISMLKLRITGMLQKQNAVYAPKYYIQYIAKKIMTYECVTLSPQQYHTYCVVCFLDTTNLPPIIIVHVPCILSYSATYDR